MGDGTLLELARVRTSEQQASNELAVAEYALIIEATLVAERSLTAPPDLSRLRELAQKRTEARDRHALHMRAYRTAVARLNLPPPQGEFDA